MMETIVKRKERLQAGKFEHVGYINQCGLAKIFNIRKNEENIINILDNVKIKIWKLDDSLQFEIVDFDDKNGTCFLKIYFMKRKISPYLYEIVCFDKNDGIISSDFNTKTAVKNSIYYDDIIIDKNAYFM